MGTGEVVMKGLKVIEGLGSSSGDIVWSSMEVTYPDDLQFVPSGEGEEHKNFFIAQFYKPAQLYDEDDIPFLLDGTFRPYSEDPWVGSDGTLHEGGSSDPQHPVMANVRVEMPSMAHKASKSHLEVHFTVDRTTYGDAKDPRIKILIQGHYKPAGAPEVNIDEQVMLNSWGQIDPQDGIHVTADPSITGEVGDAL
jgi:hypothetical protein